MTCSAVCGRPRVHRVRRGRRGRPAGILRGGGRRARSARRGEDAEANEPQDASSQDDESRDDEPEDAAPEDVAPEDAAPEDAAPEDAAPEDAPEDAAPSSEDSDSVERAPNITPDMTYEEEQAEYARFAEEERARNEAIAAEAARLNAEAEAAAATLPEEPVPSGADVASANEAFGRRRRRDAAPSFSRRRRRDAAPSSRRTRAAKPSSANDSTGVARRTRRRRLRRSGWRRAPNRIHSRARLAVLPRVGHLFVVELSMVRRDGRGRPVVCRRTFETFFAEAPAANPDVNPENSAVPDADSPDSSDLPFPYSFEAATETVAPSEKEDSARRDARARMALRETAAQALEAYAKRLPGKRRTRHLSTLSRSPSRSRTRPSRPARRWRRLSTRASRRRRKAAYGANDGNATTAFPRSSAFPRRRPTSSRNRRPSLDGGVRPGVRRHRNRRRCARRV